MTEKIRMAMHKITKDDLCALCGFCLFVLTVIYLGLVL